MIIMRFETIGNTELATALDGRSRFENCNLVSTFSTRTLQVSQVYAVQRFYCITNDRRGRSRQHRRIVWNIVGFYRNSATRELHGQRTTEAEAAAAVRITGEPK